MSKIKAVIFDWAGIIHPREAIKVGDTTADIAEGKNKNLFDFFCLVHAKLELAIRLM